MVEFVKKVLAMYEDACGLEAIATWDKDTDIQKKADVAWSRYEGAKTLLSMILHIPEKTVDEEMEMLMVEKTFA